MKKRKMWFVLLCLISVFFLSVGIVSAQTPDGETPAVETVCDEESGAAFGLCNAYCEAMDCGSEEPQASEKACSRVFDKFEQVTGEVPPCDMFCGNGVLEEGEECDDGVNDGTECNLDCTLPASGGFCGDGNVDEGEECDLGGNNGEPGSICSSSCTYIFG